MFSVIEQAKRHHHCLEDNLRQAGAVVYMHHHLECYYHLQLVEVPLLVLECHLIWSYHNHLILGAGLLVQHQTYQIIMHLQIELKDPQKIQHLHQHIK